MKMYLGFEQEAHNKVLLERLQTTQRKKERERGRQSQIISSRLMCFPGSIMKKPRKNSKQVLAGLVCLNIHEERVPISVRQGSENVLCSQFLHHIRYCIHEGTLELHRVTVLPRVGRAGIENGSSWTRNRA